MMKSIILSFLAAVFLCTVGCTTTYRTYANGNYYDSVIDSINTADRVSIPDTSAWLKNSFVSNKGIMWQYLYTDNDLVMSVHKTPYSKFLYRYSNTIKKRKK